MKKMLLVCVLCISAFAGKLVEPKDYGSLLLNNFNYAYASKTKTCLDLTVKEKMEFLSMYNKGTLVVNGSIIVTGSGDIVDAIEAGSNGDVISYNLASTIEACNIIKDYYVKDDKKGKK